MIKIIYCITKLAGMDDAAFARYWRDVHGPIGARIPGLRKLVQSHVVRDHCDRAAPSFDGVAELGFDDIEALLAARRSVAWQQSTADEANFVDPERAAYLVTEEHEAALPSRSDTV